jgi:DNA-binding IscR family transcriptional regulator
VCNDEAACPMHEYWKKASSAFRDRLKKTTLADLVAFAYIHPECAYPHQDRGSMNSLMAMRPGVRSAM